MIPVTLKNYKIAESDLTNGNVVKLGAINKLVHFPVQPFDLSNQTVVRMNQDTIYSAAVIDVSKGATITLPEANGRYQLANVIQNDHYINDVFVGAGTYEIKSDTDSDFVQVNIRTAIDLTDPADAAKVVALQQAIKLEVKGNKVFKQPNYNMDQLVKLRLKLANEAIALGSQKNMQGSRGKVDEHLHLLGTAVGWGLLPDANARYLAYVPEDDTGSCYQTNYKVPPFNPPGFFSITMYDAEGWMFSEKAILNKNNITFNEDGSFDASFGECGENAKNNLPIIKGWNFVMRIYEPKLDQLEVYKLPTVVKVR
ncbi:MAG: lytic murein transglycosylase [Gammaproteobacteria bacterium]|nr:MAG: lytic murein transglycosylase [Gammaproteobacteria bacterium]PHR83969.1 MAG: lytic murein transglycosylase [Colwellia sp.]